MHIATWALQVGVREVAPQLGARKSVPALIARAES
jgi:hypothetical protein